MALKLPRFLRNLSIVDEKGTPTVAFHQWWESVLKQIENSVNAIQDALQAAGIAQAAAEAAQDAADIATGAANNATQTAKLTASGVTGLSLTATDAGADATISVSSHTRVYGDGTSVSVNGANLAGLAYSTTYYVYYDDPSFAGGTVSYQFTTSQATAAQTGVRHLVGGVTTPAAGGGGTTGGSPKPPGFGGDVP